MARLAGIPWSEVTRVPEWRFAAWLGFDLAPTDGAIGSQAPSEVQRAIRERAVALMSLPEDVKQARADRLARYQRLRADPKARREASQGIGRAAPNDRIVDDGGVYMEVKGG